MRRFLYTAALLLLPLASMAATKTAKITISPSTRYQHIDGFGGTAMTPDWRDAFTQQKVNLLWGQGPNQVGLNIMRIRINPNEGNWGEYGNPIRWARLVCPDLQVFATPWTPPKKYKTHNTNKYQNDFGTWVWPLVEHSWGGEGSNGGAINPDYYDEFADFLERYRQTMAQKGCPIDIISIQNESDYTPTVTENGVEHASYESCIYSPTQMAAMCKALRQKLDPSCKIMGPECFGWEQHKYNNRLVTIPDAVNNIDIWGNHLYGTNDWNFVRSVTNKTGRPMWETEFLIDYASGYDGNFTVEYPMIESIEKAMTSGYSAYVYYSMFYHFFASNHGGSENQLWKRAWVFSHYAKNATGKRRVLSSLSGGNSILKGGSSYVSEDGDTVVVMLLNTSATDTYNVTVSLPFAPLRIQQVVTGPTANAQKTDVTALYASDNSKNPVVTLQPGHFYTFLFIKNIDAADYELATSVKEPEWGNPLSASHFMADPTAVEYNGRMYVWATDDQQEFDFVGGLAQNSYSHISRLVCMSTDDLVNWTMHDPIDVKTIAPWANCSWAPSVVSRTEADGKTHFYLYFTNGASSIGVLTATDPTGPWTDPLGHALIDGNTPGLGQISWIIDPGAAISDDGQQAYLTFGGGDILTGATELMPGNARIVKLGADMISLDGDILTIPAPCHLEANELNCINGKWYYSYCTRWNISSEWSSYSKKNAPGAAAMVYMTSTDPISGTWSYQGVILPNLGTLGYPYGNNHSHIQKFNSKYYLLYHSQWLEHEHGMNGGYRNIQLNKLTLAGRQLNITTFTAATAAITGEQQLTEHYVNPFQQQSGRMAAISTFTPLSNQPPIIGIMDWWMVRGVDFRQGDAPARSLILHVKGTGTVEVRPNSVTADAIATASFNAADGEKQVEVPLSGELQEMCQQLYFVITDNDNAEVLTWQFSSQELQGIDTVHESFPTTDNAIYSLQGQRIGTTQRGIYIRNGRKIIR